MCGEHSNTVNRLDRSTGSSPHVRGTHHLQAHRRELPGIIPACAGNTLYPISHVTLQRDHPRMCGEHSPTLAAGLNTMGSSPHVRGTHLLEKRRNVADGIIPACAGNTMICNLNQCQARDHPRMCGEHTRRVWRVPIPMGSSPHVRGTHLALEALALSTGIIPACAGNTKAVWNSDHAHRDHPRMCGEHVEDEGVEDDAGGSSPHVRGTPSVSGSTGSFGGIIPACAGNTTSRLRRRDMRWDHPRMCGEH